ncbi:uncharacterized protein Z519_12014 [Cladophialophora bantiana CBS 173.52]|uniref:Heterokaryon incompatibility domain-containing protein n=1 Tax=Cladophialophora bantiana (strain ATCC 10958 / CBS 173.52 / CDC B-1940 / NIH 8579) TaxID=1442370 RepID=A0A0D2H245_CLAB1|nr:uncharacterized protein Z519_12014 [Cladophialophora bantiana CBS 173.52]KIW87378.1 hypothetical protein Z519_12014 [Cladophialophora bantiana CBS 173.52]
MNCVGASEEVPLCDSCRSLHLDTRLLPQDSGDTILPESIRFSPDACSLCSLINKWLLRYRPAAGTSAPREQDSKAVIPDTGVVFRRETGNGHDELIRRFKLYLSWSHPRLPIAEFWLSSYPVPTARRFSESNRNADSSFPSGRLIEDLVDVRLLQCWMRLCHVHHGDACAQPPWMLQNDSIPPNFRLIDLQERCVVDSPAHPSYFALSYVWGPSENDLRATSASIDDLRKPHSLTQEVLPRTIFDVMQLILGLGGRYLWVDRLCILQDDDMDKSLQIPRMDSIYSLAELTVIAASGSGAHDGIAGLSVPRKVDQDVCRISPTLALVTFPTKNLYESSVYSHRGWTLQERVLSRRSLMFTEGQASWSCICADWTERLCLEPDSSGQGANSWTISRIHLGSYERVPAEYYRDFTRNHYKHLPRFYALKGFSHDSDALDAISGLLRRITHVTGVEFSWGHLLTPSFDQSLSWRKTTMEIKRRDAMCPLRSSGSSYSVHFPSWSWLGWKASIKNVMPSTDTALKPEIDFFRLDIDGKIWRLTLPVAGDKAVDQSASLPDEAGSGWKGEVKIEVDRYNKDQPFRDSGKLLFWTSHAALLIQAEKRVRLGCVRLKICSPSGQTVGHITELTSACDHGRAWPFIEYDESALQSFIVTSRKYDQGMGQHSGTLSATGTLRVMWIKWEDVEGKTASRISVGEVDEQSWINVKRDWRLVVLQ